MLKSCYDGHLDVAKWLKAARAAKDIRNKNLGGYTPMLIACYMGHLDFAKCSTKWAPLRT